MTAEQDFTAEAPPPPAIRVGVAAIVRQTPERGLEVLAAWRSRQAIRGGAWEFPGGKIEAGETAADAARRETREELDFEIEVIRTVDVAKDFDPKQAGEHHVSVELVLARPCEDEPRVRDRTWNWWRLDELDQLPWPRANAPLIEALRRDLACGDPLGPPRS